MDFAPLYLVGGLACYAAAFVMVVVATAPAPVDETPARPGQYRP